MLSRNKFKYGIRVLRMKWRKRPYYKGKYSHKSRKIFMFTAKKILTINRRK